MTITQRLVGAVTILELPVPFDAESGVTEFLDTVGSLVERGCTRILVDMDRTTWLHDTGLTGLVKAYTIVRRHGGAMKLLNFPKGFGFGLLTATKLLTIFDAFDNEADAIASFGTDRP